MTINRSLSISISMMSVLLKHGICIAIPQGNSTLVHHSGNLVQDTGFQEMACMTELLWNVVLVGSLGIRGP